MSHPDFDPAILRQVLKDGRTYPELAKRMAKVLLNEEECLEHLHMDDFHIIRVPLFLTQTPPREGTNLVRWLIHALPGEVTMAKLNSAPTAVFAVSRYK